MYAIIQTGGKQYRVQKDDVLAVEKLSANGGDKVQFNSVLLTGGKDIKVGAPLIKGAGVQATVIDQIRDRGVKALFIENINNPKLLQMISEESGVAIGGLLYSDALSDLEGPAATYLDMMRHNLESLIEAFEFEHT